MKVEIRDRLPIPRFFDAPTGQLLGKGVYLLWFTPPRSAPPCPSRSSFSPHRPWLLLFPCLNPNATMNTKKCVGKQGGGVKGPGGGGKGLEANKGR